MTRLTLGLLVAALVALAAPAQASNVAPFSMFIPDVPTARQWYPPRAHVFPPRAVAPRVTAPRVGASPAYVVGPPVVVRQPVWVDEQWAWDGWQWVWVPGHWWSW